MLTEVPTYLDHNATTPVKPEVRDLMLEMLTFPGNASSVHQMGRRARRHLEESRQKIKTFVNAGPKDVVVFTSGATEANNMVLQGVDAERVIVSAIEHPSVLQAAPSTRETAPVTPDGVIDLAALEKMLAGNTRQTLVSVMLANNETGVIQPLADIMALARRHGALVHTDAVQAAGKIPLDIQALGVDFLTLSAHKMGGPQGVGCLVVANCAPVSPLLKGGGQERNLRAGTENLAGIAGFARAAELADVSAFQRLSVLRDRMEAELQGQAPALRVFGRDVARICNTSLFSHPALKAETLLIALDLEGICVSNGSACSSGTVKPSHVLQAMGVPEAEIAGALRVSLGWDTAGQDVENFVRQWSAILQRKTGTK